MKRKFFAALTLSAALLCGCGNSAVTDEPTAESGESEESEAQTLTVSDTEYYTRFKDDNISINVYNWGEYISTGADEGTLNVNAEFTKLTGIKVNYTNYATNEELYAKLKGGGASYDIIIPSDYMISKIGSMASCGGDLGSTAYACAKAGVDMLTKSTALQYG
ncbi:MAG: hypothetical protein ACI4XA_05545, partial [Oscillospiraceae bacterium]